MSNLHEFITTYTELRYLDFVPEIRLFLREDRNLHEFLKQEDLVSHFPFWGTAWAGGQVLARYILDNPQSVKDKEVVDYCSGSGIVGIAAMMAGARVVTCVDIDPLSTQVAEINARANKVTLRFGDNFDITDLLLSGDPTPNSEVFEIIDRYPSIIGCPIRKETLTQHYQKITSYFLKTYEFPKGIEAQILTNIQVQP